MSIVCVIRIISLSLMNCYNPPPAKTTFIFLYPSRRNTSFLESISAAPIIRSQRKLGKAAIKIPSPHQRTNSQISIIETFKPPIPPVPLPTKGCFCLTGSEIHLPTSVPFNIPRRSVSQRDPNPQQCPTGSPNHIGTRPATGLPVSHPK